MKTHLFSFLFLNILFGFSQESTVLEYPKLKQQILSSKEVKEWQNSLIAFQRSNLDFCALKSEQKLDQALFLSFGKNYKSTIDEEFILKLFRTMRITDELRADKILKERTLRKRFPQLASHFRFDEIFPEIYAPIKKARDKYLKRLTFLAITSS